MCPQSCQVKQPWYIRYYKVRQVLQSVTECCYKVCQVLQSVAGCYHNVRHVLQSVTVSTK